MVTWQVPLPAGQAQGRPPIAVHEVHVSPRRAAQQQVHYPDVTHLGGMVEGGIATFLIPTVHHLCTITTTTNSSYMLVV